MPRVVTAHRPSRHGLTVLELLVSFAIIGILLAILLPALGAARESARYTQCASHLRELGIALHHHHEVRRSLPAGWQFDPTASSAYGWTVPLLPYIEQAAVASQIDLKTPLGAPQLTEARNTSLPLMLCPSDIVDPMFTLYEGDEEDDEGKEGRYTGQPFMPSVQSEAIMRLPTANYVGVFGTLESDDEIPAPIGDGTFLENRVVRFRDFLRGLSHTVIVGERTMAQVPSTWLGVSLAGEDAAARLVGSALQGINHPLADESDFSSRHPGGANFLWGDGHVSLVSENIDLIEYQRSAQLYPR
ncbi:DUF1559 domain-containing protein [Rhodopirellula sp. MGV]|uniref:DUF1559 domain-containing protein n=1 Tax=Rhodopirellula sp. MGV TaxID=2023130 RepID=UPI000B9767CE|nr:DUF1559 domain-containing protein [Rhodopirellula sp. MGV]OYP30003.1 hypothetical protein CGZ80_23600 [Rhodopirellula sp. MGV]PNY33456.1 DUF1559 domain-containing protein [Rhodopirellula baltica]